jgi:hypothetical protein
MYFPCTVLLNNILDLQDQEEEGHRHDEWHRLIKEEKQREKDPEGREAAASDFPQLPARTPWKQGGDEESSFCSSPKSQSSGI